MTSGTWLPTSSGSCVVKTEGDFNISGGTFTMAASGATGPITTLNIKGTVVGTTGKLTVSGTAH